MDGARTLSSCEEAEQQAPEDAGWEDGRARPNTRTAGKVSFSTTLSHLATSGVDDRILDGGRGTRREVDLVTYQSDWKTQRIVERTLHLAIESCMDVADHIVADRRLRVPATGTETFDVLGEAGMLPLVLSEALAKMVGFRNILLHDYARLDPEIVLRVLGGDLQDLERFRRAVLQLV